MGEIDKRGKVIIPGQCDDTFWFAEGLTVVSNNKKMSYINKIGELVILYQYDFTFVLSEGLAL